MGVSRLLKRVIGITVLLFLTGLMIFNIVNKSNKQTAIVPNEIDVTENSELQPANLPGIAEGELAPNFKLESLDGGTVQLSDFLGKKVIVNFWASWCGPCRQEMPAMQAFYDDYADDVEVLAVNATESETNLQAVQSFIGEFNFTYPTLLDEDLSVNEAYKIIGLPTTYFIGTDGVIQAPNKIGPMTYEFMVEMMEILE